MKYDFSKLSLDERLHMAEALWESISADSPPVPEWHLEEVRRRIALEDSGEMSYVTLEEALEKMRKL